jgi:hypothetical protein
MNTPDNNRGNIPAFLNSFPYVNGGLFRNQHNIPQFSRKSRTAIIESGELDWSAINPDIFGSMIQAVITPEHRGGLGMHYTSVPNIMKVIEPLFLNDYYEEFETSKGNSKRLLQLLNRIWNTKFFDPACGSGNFLIITYKELRKLEMSIIKEYDKLKSVSSGFSEIQLSLLPKAQLRLGDEETSMLQFDSKIQLTQFYGIELDDFAHEVAILSLWLAEHQMNQVFFNEFGRSKPALPLTSAGNIIHGNACRLDWEIVCPKEKDSGIYILGNPPYVGFKGQNQEQKRDMELIFKGLEDFKSLDFISCWFYKASKYIEDNISTAFVTTNSICQGSQVSMLWRHIFKQNVEIHFAYSSFQWSNNAKNNAGVSVSIIGLRKNSNKQKYLYINNLKILANNINAYLIDYPHIIVDKRKVALSKLPKISDGCGALDGGNLMLTDLEKHDLITDYPNSLKFIKPLVGSEEMINGILRWCIWIEDFDVIEANEIPPIKIRLSLVRKARNEGGTSAQSCKNTPNRFAWINRPAKTQIVIPTVSSERREYIPISFFSNESIISNSASIVHDPENYVFAIITSRIHNVWVKTIAGKLENRIRYTSAVCYNTFPFPSISENQKNDLEKHVYRVLEERENHSEKTLAQLYDPDKMPKSLLDAHHQLDLAVENCYRSKPFKSDEERLEYLFKLYEQMIEEEKSNGTLFGTESVPKKKKK